MRVSLTCMLLVVLSVWTGVQAAVPAFDSDAYKERRAIARARLDGTDPVQHISHHRELAGGSPNCPTVPHFTFYPYEDISTSDWFYCRDLGQLTAAQLALNCAANPLCLSFSLWTGSSGQVSRYCLNKVAGPRTNATKSYMTKPCQGMYVQDCPSAPKGYTFLKSRYLYSPVASNLGCYVMGKQTLSDRAKQCSADSKCAGFLVYLEQGKEQICFYPAGYTDNVYSNLLSPNKCYGTYVKSTPSTPWLPYLWGPIMANTINVYMIYVGGYKPSDLLPKTVDHFVANLGGSDWWRTNKLYYMDPPNVSKRTYSNGQLKLASSIYVNSVAGLKLAGTDHARDVASVIIGSIKGKQLPWDAENGIYFVISKTGVFNQQNCGDNNYCGRHRTWANYDSGPYAKMKFAYIQEGGCIPQGSTCSMSANAIDVPAYNALTSPTGSPSVDGIVSIVAHELSETVTDPELNINDAWRDINGDENADLCSWNVGNPNTHKYSNGTAVLYNAVMGGKPYLIQLNWVPTLVPGSKPQRQWGCVYGVDKAGKVMTQPPKLLAPS